jgi:hypothetical protein
LYYSPFTNFLNSSISSSITRSSRANRSSVTCRYRPAEYPQGEGFSKSSLRDALLSAFLAIILPVSPPAGKENEMLQQVTIRTTDLEQFKSMLKTALEREAKLLEYSIQRTREALAPFEKRFNMSTDEFERKFKNREIEETLDFLDWWMEVEALRHLEIRRDLIKDARVE